MAKQSWGLTGGGLKRRAEVQAAVGQDEGSRLLGPKTFRDLVRRDCVGSGERLEGFRIHSAAGAPTWAT